MPPGAQTADPAPGPLSPRFELRGVLGQGGMGIVYRAYDRERGVEVALKHILDQSASSIYHLKHEFRMLADIVHPNLVTLHELLVEEGRWFFTMDLIEGTDLLSYLGRPQDAIPSTGPTAAAPEPQSEQTPAESPAPLRRPVQPLDLSRLRAVFLQLTDALEALHAARRRHGDLKPSNIRIDARGHVVVLDFGVTRSLVQGPELPTGLRGLFGTPEYMAPEQACGEPVGPEADWYALGTILYKVLTGALPFAGHRQAILRAKRHQPVLAPSERAAGIPAELGTLCMDLLIRDPSCRAGGAAVRAALSGLGERLAPEVSGPTSLFVGRQGELRRLSDLLERSRAGEAVPVYVHGTSGIGKSTLLHRFLDIARGDGALVLAGRCYERESVPFKAIDPIIDALVSHLAHLPRARVAELCAAAEVDDLCRVFPVLRTLDPLRRASGSASAVSLPEMRRRAFAQLRALLREVRRQGPLIIAIDDLQWGDRDSALLLEELLRPPDAPAVLWLGTFRTEEERSSPLLAELLRPAERDAPRPVLLPLQGLAAAEVAELTRAALLAVPSARVEQVSREVNGNPFLLLQLLRHLESPPGGSQGDEPVASATFSDAIRSRLRLLPPRARHLLEVIAVAGRPLGQGVALRAAGAAAAPELLAPLRAERMIRTRGPREQDLVEVYHDRIREAVVAEVASAALLAHHLSLAEVLDAAGADPEFVMAHFERAGDRQSAARHALIAAAAATESLAFEHAASLYQRALDLGAAGQLPESHLHELIADALLNAGRGQEAARSYLRAAAAAPRERVLELERKATLQLLTSGHVDEGLALLRRILRAVELPYRDRSPQALLQLVARRGWLHLRGLAFEARAESQIPPATLLRVDICFAASVGLSVLDSLRAATFQAEHLRLALEAGEPGRIAVGMAFEAAYLAASGPRSWARSREMMRRGQELAERGPAHAQGFVRLMEGVAEWAMGDFLASSRAVEAAEVLLRERCVGVAWELAMAGVTQMICLATLGDLAQLRRRHGAWLEAAESRGDRLGSVCLRTIWGAASWLSLAADEPDLAERELLDTMGGWVQDRYLVQHYYALLAHAQIDLYRGEGAAAWRRVEDGWPKLRRSMLLSFRPVRITAQHIRGAAALSALQPGASERARSSLLRVADGAIQRLLREGLDWSSAVALQLQASAAAIRGDSRLALRSLQQAAALFDRLGMTLHRAACWRGAGLLVGGDQGSGRVQEAEAELRARGVREPARMARVLTPGLPTER